MPIFVCANRGGAMQGLNRNGVLTDRCTNYRGVWPDRGEMDKLLSMRPTNEGTTGEEECEDRGGRKRKRRDWFGCFDFG